MPLYEYKCGTCGRVIEVRQKFSDEPLSTHEGCGGALEKLISSSSLQFKGSGFYVNDYAKPGGGNGKSKTESKPETKTESKPAPAADTSKK